MKNQCFWFKETHMKCRHWGRVTQICVGNLTIIGSDNGVSLGRRQAIIWTNAGILLIGSLGTNFSEICIEVQAFSFKERHLKMSSAKWRPFCHGLNVLISLPWVTSFLVPQAWLLDPIIFCYRNRTFSYQPWVALFTKGVFLVAPFTWWYLPTRCTIWAKGEMVSNS